MKREIAIIACGAVAIVAIAKLVQTDDAPPPVVLAAPPIAKPPPPPAQAPVPIRPPPHVEVIESRDRFIFTGTPGARILRPHGDVLGKIPMTYDTGAWNEGYPLELRFERDGFVPQTRTIHVGCDCTETVDVRLKRR